ncbi:GNAT family N-acetyltransferase [Chengkuizengella axinellae]|uniref:GNAT family N-acetyltransferase n=1 Tax=Chengkuizengella axinellae TaxID=3064388 RepID=A0ABT9J365_9BACL|nr:GNAT family N-acetyltransferase [Chengkuizengella sp. 2205SS18-9]MDP5275429.1 GNAT family N-acetyltransferase [Chengkuizengella sp. 2205SS18-9]
MTTLQDIFALDYAYLETFTNQIDTTWGSIFYNENQPNYYTANHAHISNECQNPQKVIKDVIDFFNSKNIIPRFYIYNLKVQQDLLSELKSSGFKYEEFISPVQLWNNDVVEIMNKKHVKVEKVTNKNLQEALELECSIKEFGEKETIEKLYKEQYEHHAFTHYLLRYNGKACSTACIFVNDKQAQMESVATIEEFRGKGLIGELIHFIQREVIDRGVEKLWVFPINESVEKVYRKYGFQTVFKMNSGHAYLSGKSIKEIHG